MVKKMFWKFRPDPTVFFCQRDFFFADTRSNFRFLLNQLESDCINNFPVHTEKYFLNFVKSNRIWIKLIHLDFSDWFFNQKENGNRNLIPIYLTRIRKRFLCVLCTKNISQNWHIQASHSNHGKLTHLNEDINIYLLFFSYIFVYL